MKKVMYLISSVAAVSLLVGCGSSSSSSSSPSFAQKTASVESADSAADATAAVVNGTNVNVGVDAVIKTVLKNKNIELADVLGKITNTPSKKLSTLKKLNLKNFVAKKLNITSIEPMEVNNSRCVADEDYQQKNCNVSGYLYVQTKVEPQGDECVVTLTYGASNCKMTESGDNHETNESINGYESRQFRLLIDEEGDTVNNVLVGFKLQDKFTYAASGSGKNENNETYNFNENYKANIAAELAVKYHLDENKTIISDNIMSFALNGTLNYNGKYTEGNDTREGNFKFGSNFKEIYDLTKMDQNIFHLQDNGWINEEINFPDYENNFTIAFQNFNAYYNGVPNFNNLSELDINVSGKIGDQCIGGLVGLDTEKIIENNITDAYDLPNAGLLKINGANNTYATVRFYFNEDYNTTVAEVNTSTGESKEYNTTRQLEEGSCNGDFVDPFEF